LSTKAVLYGLEYCLVLLREEISTEPTQEFA